MGSGIFFIGFLGIFLFILGITVCMGLPTALVASARGRNFLGWLVIGTIFPIFGLILALVLPDVNDERLRRERADQDARRQREQLSLERTHREGIQQHVERRLDAHDRALGVDTRSVDTRGVDTRELGAPTHTPSASLAAATDRPASPPAATSTHTQTAAAGMGLATFSKIGGLASVPWHLSDDHVQSREVSFDELARRYREGRTTDRSLVWTDGMKDWRAVGEFHDLRSRLA